MKKIVYQFRFSKFRRIADGFLFAVISCAALLLCISEISANEASRLEAMLPFTVAIISMILGLKTMTNQPEVKREKV